MKSIVKAINLIEEKMLVYSFMLTVILVFIQVCMRGVGNSLPWSEELSRYLFIWQCWVGVSFAERFGKHIRIEFIINKLSPRGQDTLNIIQMVLTLGIVVFLVVYGVQMVVFLVGAGTVSSAMKLPMYLVYTAMPISCAVYGLRLVLRIYQIISGKGEFA